MILGMTLKTFTEFHVLLSLVGILAGVIVALAMLSAKRVPITTAVFLITTAATDLTGFLFPMPFDPADVVGIISLVFVALATLALYSGKLAGDSLDITIARADGSGPPLETLTKRVTD